MTAGNRGFYVVGIMIDTQNDDGFLGASNDMELTARIDAAEIPRPKPVPRLALDFGAEHNRALFWPSSPAPRLAPGSRLHTDGTMRQAGLGRRIDNGNSDADGGAATADE